MGVTAVAVAGLAVGVVGLVSSMSAQAQQAEAQANALRYQAQVAENNRQIGDQLADRATKAGEAQVSAQRLKTAAAIGGIKAHQGASGLDINSGSAVDIQSTAAEMGELDALTIRNNAAMQSYSYKLQGAGYGQTAALSMAGAQNAQTAGNLSQFTSLAGGASSIADKWVKYQNAGLLTSGDTSSGTVGDYGQTTGGYVTGSTGASYPD